MKPINQLLSESSPNLSHLVQRSRQFQQLARLLQKDLPVQCHIINIKKSEIVVHVPNATIATYLRFQTPTLIATWQHYPLFSELQVIKIRVRFPVSLSSQQKVLPKRSMTTQTAQYLIETANTITHPQLKACLLKLSRHQGEIDKGCK